MPAPFHGWLYMRDAAGAPREIFNHARTAAYLKNPSLRVTDGPSITDVLDFGGCRAYTFEPPTSDNEPGYIQTFGSVNNGLQVADAAALDLTGDLSLIVDLAMDDWTPGTARTLIGKWSTAAQLSYVLAVDAFGTPSFSWTVAGTTVLSIGANANLGFLANGARQAIRVDFDANNGAAGRTAHFFRAPTIAGPWTRLGTAQTTATATSIHSGSSSLQIGLSFILSNPVSGKIYAAQVRNSPSFTETIGGAAVFDFTGENIRSRTAPTFVATSGQTVTVLSSGGTPAILNPGEAEWEEQFFTTPTLDAAPWYNSMYPESADALGFFVEEWTGLDSPHIVRPVSPRHRGGQLGVLSTKERVMKLNVVLFSRTEKAMEYLFRWLETTLSSICAGCGVDSILVRRYCPNFDSNTSLWDGVAEMREVGLIEGLSWESEPLPHNQCLVRRLSFTLAAGDPCLYSNDTDVAVSASANMATCLSTATIDPERSTCRPSCVELPSACRTVFTFTTDSLGAAGPVLTLDNNTEFYGVPLRAICYADPAGIGVSPNPCGLPILGELYTAPQPPYSTLVWDVAGRRVTYYDHSTGDDVGGWAFVGANDPPIPRFFALPCGTAHVVLEPASLCLTEDGSDWLSGTALLGTAPAYPTATLAVQERFGCA
jgi:hypothetical protein